jgi:hypothetical protein
LDESISLNNYVNIYFYIFLTHFSAINFYAPEKSKNYILACVVVVLENKIALSVLSLSHESKESLNDTRQLLSLIFTKKQA